MTITDTPGTDLEVAGPPTGLARLTEWVDTLAATAKGVEYIIDTPFVPASFWPLPRGIQLRDWPNPALRHPREEEADYTWRRQVAIASTTTALTVGAELGLGPNAALKYLYVTRGRPQMYAEGMLALFHARGHRSRMLDRSAERCAIGLALRGSSEFVEFEFTYADAERAKYPEQNAKYRTDPKAMLWARVISIGVRSVAPEVLGGIAGEADGYDDVVEGEVISSTPATVTVAELSERPLKVDPERVAAELDRQAGKAEPPVDDLPAAGPVPPVEPAPLDESAWRRVNDAFVRLGVTGPGQKGKRLAIVCHIIGRTVASATELSAVEGDLLLETLNGLTRPGVTALLSDLLVDRGPAGGDQGPAAPEAAPAAATGPQAAEGWPADVDPSDADLEPTADELEQYARLEAEQNAAGGGE